MIGFLFMIAGRGHGDRLNASMEEIRCPMFRIISPAAFALCLPLAPLLFGAAPLRAEMTPWATNEGGRMRIVALPPRPDGTVRGALQIEPKPGWITYWKEPGDAGIPPQVVFSRESGITQVRVSYPVPKRIDSGKLKDIGYDTPVALPFELTVRDPGRPLNLAASAFVGLCQNICIPFQADFSLALKQVGGTPAEEAMIVNQAMSKVPEPPSHDFAVLDHAITPDLDTLHLKLRLPGDTTAPSQVIVTGPQGHVLIEGINGRRDGDRYSLDMPVGKLPRNYDVTGKQWGILVIAGDRAMETSLAFN